MLMHLDKWAEKLPGRSISDDGIRHIPCIDIQIKLKNNKISNVYAYIKQINLFAIHK